MGKHEDSKTQLSRRAFLAGGAFLGFGLTAEAAAKSSNNETHVMNSKRSDADYDLAHPDNILYSSCLQCNTGCGIKCKIQDGVLTKIDGNPYSPWGLLPHLPAATTAAVAAAVDASLCPKGIAGVQTAYDPYRLRKVLKRAGHRGDNKWVSIDFNQAVKEIVEGGKLFSKVAGEENRDVEGLRRLAALRDPKIASAMEKDIKAIWDEKDAAKKTELVALFKTTHAANLGLLIDPEHPDFGPRNNQIVVAWGRLKGGRSELYKRFSTGLGTTNAHGHTTVCQGSLYFTCKALSEQYIGGKFTDGQKFYWQTDIENAKFILFVGANLLEANYGPTNRGLRLMDNVVNNKTKIACIDPRFSKLASKSWKWVPVKPGVDAAIAMGIMRWMLDNNRYDAKFLSSANKAAAVLAGENSWTNAPLLVEVKDGKPGKFVRAADHALATPEKRTLKDGKEYEEKFLVAMAGGVPVAVDPNDEKTPVVGDLFVDAALPDGTKVKSGLQILADSIKTHTVEEWAKIADIPAKDIVELAEELTSYGKQGSVDIHRGVAQHTNGFYNVLSWMSVNMLLGNFDAAGGMIKASTYDYIGKGELHDLKAQPNAITPFGISSIRHGLDYEKTTVFKGYPAKRNWYPLSSDIYEEIVPSIGDKYPYPAKALFLYMGAPTYSLPAGHTNVDILADTEKLPLFVASDIVIGSTSMYADYIFPDLTYLERWEFQGSHPNIANKVQPVRQPVIAPLTEQCVVYGQSMPMSFESMMLAIAEQMQLPGFGKDAFGPGKNLEHPDDFYLRGVANIAFGESKDGSGAVPDADAEEIRIFRAARKHLPTSVFDEKRWQKIAGPEVWAKTIHVLSRGGRFEAHEKGWKDGRAGHPYGALLNLYQEKTAGTIHAGTGKKNAGYAQYIPIQDFHGRDPKQLRDGYDLAMITHRVISQTKSRTIANPWLSALMPENGILINPADVSRLKLQNGQSVRVVSATNEKGVYPLGNAPGKDMIGKVVETQTISPGVISFALGFGHWATGASDVEVNGQVIKGEKRRRAGIHANAAMWIDPALKNTCMLDPVGGSVSFYDTFVRLVPA